MFVLGCHYSGQILSYQKMIGQLQDAGNTTTLSNYLTLMSGAWLLTGLEKFAGDQARSRASSPKLQALNLALVSAQLGTSFEAALNDRELWGRLVESAVGAHLHNYKPSGVALQYWRERADEVDFVLSQGERLTAIEVKSGRRRDGLPGIGAFLKAYPKARPLLVGADGVRVDEFLLKPIEAWFV
jgi:predicted AAA+ superfamily ATPase